VLARDVVPIAVGGVGPAAFGDWLAAGAKGFGLGSELYRVGDTAAAVAAKARVCMAAVGELRVTGVLMLSNAAAAC
jgi:2-dehydro-3-deoxyphosphogalactonate aldolase